MASDNVFASGVLGGLQGLNDVADQWLKYEFQKKLKEQDMIMQQQNQQALIKQKQKEDYISPAELPQSVRDLMGVDELRSPMRKEVLKFFEPTYVYNPATKTMEMMSPLKSNIAKTPNMQTESELDKLLNPEEAIKLDVPYGTTRRQAIGKTPYKPSTDTQKQEALYANRIAQANANFDNYENAIRDMSVIGQATRRKVPNFLKGETMQLQEQAERNFVNAVLRRESGAVINPSEFVDARKQYLPVPGDNDSVLAEKKRNRMLVQEQFIKAAGNAYAASQLAVPRGTPTLVDTKQQVTDLQQKLVNKSAPGNIALTGDKAMRLQELRAKQAQGTLK